MSEKYPTIQQNDELHEYDFPVYQPTTREVAKQKNRLLREKLFLLVTNKMLGKTEVKFLRKYRNKLVQSRFERQADRPEVRSTRNILKDLINRESVDSEKPRQYYPLPSVIEVNDPESGLTYSTLRRYEGTAINQFCYLDSTEINGQLNCLRIMVPKSKFEQADCYVLQFPTLKVRDESTLNIILEILVRNITSDLILSDLENMTSVPSEYAAIRLFHFLKRLNIDECKNPQEIIEIIQDPSLWTPANGEIVVTQITSDGQIVQNSASDKLNEVINTGEIQGTFLNGDNTAQKENFVVISEPVTTNSTSDGWRVGTTFNQYFLPLVIKYSNLHQLRLGSSDKAKGKRVENERRNLVQQPSLG